MGGRSHVFYCHVKNRWALVFSVLKSTRHRSTPVDGLIINIQRSRTPLVFKKCLILLRSVFDTDTNEPRHTLCVRLSNPCVSPAAHSDIVAHLRHNARMHDYTVLVNQWLLEKGIILERPMSGETGQKLEWVMWANSPQPSNNRS